MIIEATQRLSRGDNLTGEQMRSVMRQIMTGQAETNQIAAFLSALSEKGETIEEVAAAASVMREFVTKIHTARKIVLDTCGTGGDSKGTFNVSTVVAFVVSGCGIAVAKHGNRSVSSRCGSADILERLGININLSPQNLGRCLDDIGIAFLFAVNLHPAMKYAMPARKQIGARTIFNILGPLVNPAAATHQLLGVFKRRLTEQLAVVLAELGTRHAIVVHGEDGLDEITTTAKTFASEVRNHKINNFQVAPEDFGIRRANIGDLSGGDAALNAAILLDILNAKPGPKRDIVVLNAAAAIYAADKVKSIKEGIGLAEESIDSGQALKKLELLKEFSKEE
jgi:anthranilate phosphoribosyltransferase